MDENGNKELPLYALPIVEPGQHHADNGAEETATNLKRPTYHFGMRRAKQICQHCRAKKIRCDVGIHGRPCTNCRRRTSDCILAPKPLKRKRTPIAIAPATKDHLDLECAVAYSKPPVADISDSPADTNLPLPLKDIEILPETTWSSNFDFISDKCTGIFFNSHDLQVVYDDSTKMTMNDVMNHQLPSTTVQNDLVVESSLQSSTTNDLEYDDAPHVAMNCMFQENDIYKSSYQERHIPFVLYSCYRFVEAGSLWQLSTEEAMFLEQRGCFHLPARPALDDFVKQYFLNIHPLLPILDEGEFWTLYACKSRSTPPCPPVPLMVFQAMLFVSCSLVPLSVLRRLGFCSVQEAGLEFYARAKALFDLDTSADEMMRAQTALLLSNCSLTKSGTASTYWLTTAFHYARSVGANKYDLTDCSERRIGDLKRLWWCCILTDAILALSLRIPLTIAPSDSDLVKDCLNEDDFCRELQCYSVYDARNKRNLVRMTCSLSELAVILRDCLAILFPSGNIKAKSLLSKGIEQELQICLDKLTAWNRSAGIEFDSPSPGSNVGQLPAIFSRMISMYYHTSRALIYHHMLGHTIIGVMGTSDVGESYVQSRLALDDALDEIGKDLADLARLDLIGNLPDHFVTLLAFPYAWRVLDAKAVNIESHRRESIRIALTTYNEAMWKFLGISENTKSTLQCIEKILNRVKQMELCERRRYASNIYDTLGSDPLLVGGLAQLDHLPPSDSFWADLVENQPRTYLQVSRIIEEFLFCGPLRS
ncbi:c6 zinc finger domain containing [Fusarium albosuccineum]|uniref:C6 zinc finger domain containing n=1 Tax=Fusarium albosuccineum TaxID=1237068 RepID=A0A8H4LQ60_9HYPO|nr:c6 zinc finger domain containing [Fusarium albosuccineum]